MRILDMAVLVAALAFGAAAAEAGEVETATFSMYCYWTGEATVGRVPGVLASRIGHLAGREIVEVDFDPQITDVGQLVSALKAKKSFYQVLVEDEGAREAAEASVVATEVEVVSAKPRFIEAKHSLRNRYPDLYGLDLSEQQAIALNSWSYFGGKMPKVLTAEQRARLAEHR